MSAISGGSGPSEVTIGTGDIQIGAVEIKNGTSDTRMDVETAGADEKSNIANTASTVARLAGFNGDTWDRLRTSITTATSTTTGVLNILPVGKYNVISPTLSNGQVVVLQVDVNGNLKQTDATAKAGEDLPNDRQLVQHKFTYKHVTADDLVKTGVGVLHTLTFAQIDAAPTAGTIIVYDNTAESGQIIFSSTWTTAIFYPTTVLLDVAFSVGLYIGFTTTADIGVSVSYA